MDREPDVAAFPERMSCRYSCDDLMMCCDADFSTFQSVGGAVTMVDEQNGIVVCQRVR